MPGQLGMQVRQREIPDALFFGYDGYHHHAAANTVHRASQPGSLGLEGFSLRLSSELLRELPAPEKSTLDGMTIKVSTFGSARRGEQEGSGAGGGLGTPASSF